MKPLNSKWLLIVDDDDVKVGERNLLVPDLTKPSAFNSKVPQMITITFNGAVNVDNVDLYADIFNGNRQNPNGCQIKGTFLPLISIQTTPGFRFGSSVSFFKRK